MSLSAELVVRVVADKLVPGKKYRLQADYDNTDPDTDPNYFLGFNAVVANANGVVNFPIYSLNDYSNNYKDEDGTYRFRIVEDVPGSATQPAVTDSAGNLCTASIEVN